MISDIKITDVSYEGANKISDGRADLYLGFDILTATDPKNLDKCHPSRTIAIISTTQSPTGQMIANRQVKFPALPGLVAGIERVTRRADNVFLDGQALADGLFGDSMATNTFMVGVAYQAGTIPLKADSIEAAIREAGVAIDMSVAAFRWGRMAVIDPSFVAAESAKGSGATVAALSAPRPTAPEARALIDAVGAHGEVKRLLEIRVPELIAYQDLAYAKRYLATVKRAIDAEKRENTASTALSEAVVRYLFKLMAYKDEYEVARLQTDPAFLAKLKLQFPQGHGVRYHLAPPLFAKRDPVTGELQKREFGPWVFVAFKFLARLKGLRGGAFDVFGKTEERRQERQLVEDYVEQVEEIVATLNPWNHAAAVELASVPDEIRGYGHVKEQSIVAAKTLQAQRLAAFRAQRPVRVAA